MYNGCLLYTSLLDANNLTKSVFTGTSLNNVDFTNSDIDGIEVRLKDVYGGIFSENQALDLSLSLIHI